MLNELRNLNNLGGKDGLLFFLCDVIGKRQLSIHDAEILCSHRPGHSKLTVNELVQYCCALNWIHLDEEIIFLEPTVRDLIYDKEVLNRELISQTVNVLFQEQVFEPELFYYDEVGSFYYFRNSSFPLALFCIRNMLISQGFIIPIRGFQTTSFYIAEEYEHLVAKYCKQRKRQMSLEQLKKQIEDNEIAGDIAEKYVLEFEKKRLGSPKDALIKRVSEIDVAAGYDIASFESPLSVRLDRFIEVKAVSKAGFFWSRNEYEVAKLKAEKYYIYLVDLQRITDSEYIPEIINNPAVSIMKSEDWYVEAQSYFIKRV